MSSMAPHELARRTISSARADTVGQLTSAHGHLSLQTAIRPWKLCGWLQWPLSTVQITCTHYCRATTPSWPLHMHGTCVVRQLMTGTAAVFASLHSIRAAATLLVPMTGMILPGDACMQLALPWQGCVIAPHITVADKWASEQKGSSPPARRRAGRRAAASTGRTHFQLR